MPLGREDADRGLDLLWEFHNEAEDDAQRAAYAEAIASLHSYLTDLLPASRPSLRAKVKDGFVDVHLQDKTPVQTVQLFLSEGEKLGISIDSISEWGNSGVSPVVVSLVKPGSAADKEGSLRRGDQLVEIDGRPLSHVSLERARWLLDSAERRGTVNISMVPLGLLDGIKHSVSRDNLFNTLPTVSPSRAGQHGGRTPRHMNRKAETGDSSQKRTVLHELQPKTDMKENKVGEHHLQSNSANPIRGRRRLPFEAGPRSVGPWTGLFNVGASEDLAVPFPSERGSRLSLASSVATGKGGELTRADSFGSSGIFQRRKVRKMHIMKGAHGLGLRIIGGKGSKHGNIGIFIRDIETRGAAHSDGRLKPGDEILMVDGKSLVGLTHSEAVGVLKRTQQLVQLVVATEVSDDQSITSSMTSIPEWAKNSASAGPPPLFSSSSPHSLSPLSTGFLEGQLDLISPEFSSAPRRFGEVFSGVENIEMRGMGKKRRKASNEHIEETGFMATIFPAVKTQRLSSTLGDENGKVASAAIAMETEEVDVTLEKTEGQSLGFTVCKGNGIKDGIFVRAVNPTGVAGRMKLLREGDQLLEANGISLAGFTHKQTADIIRGLKTERVVLRVCRRQTVTHSRTSSVESGTSAATEMDTSVAGTSNEEETASHQRDEGKDAGLSPPPLPAPDSSDEQRDSEKDSQDSLPPSLPPSPPPTPPPITLTNTDTLPSPPSSPLPPMPSDDSETETEEDIKENKRQTTDTVPQLVTKTTGKDGEERIAEEKMIKSHHLGRLTDDSTLSDSDHSIVKETVVRRRVKKVVKQVVSSADMDSSDIEIKGHFMDADMQLQSSLSEIKPALQPPKGKDTEGKSTSSSSKFSPVLESQLKRKKGTESESEDGPPLGFQKLLLEMKKRANSGLGVTIVHGLGKTKGIFMVRRIMAGGVAARDKRVRPGDRLVAINNKSLRNLSHAEVLQTINEAPKEIVLEIWRDPDFELDATSSIYSIGSRSSILSDDDTEDSLSKRNSLHSLERFIRDGGRAKPSPHIARYSASMADHIVPPVGHGVSPGAMKRWSAVVLSQNIGPAGEILSSPPPPPTSPSHTFAPVPTPNTLTPSPVPLSRSSSPELLPSPIHPPHTSPPPSPSLPSQHSDSNSSQTSLPPSPPTSRPPIATVDSLPMQTSNDNQQDTRENTWIPGLEQKVVERPKSLGPVPKGGRLEHGPFEIEITKSIFGLGLTIGMGNVGMIVVESLMSRSPIKKDGNIRVGDHLLSINDSSLIGVDVATAESMVKNVSRGVVRFVAMAPPKDVTGVGMKSGDDSSNHPPLPSTLLPSSTSPPPPPASPLPEVIDELGIIRTKLKRFGNAPLGLVLEGGRESSLKYIFIKSIAFGSPAFNSGLFARGDQLVMVGSECLIGMSLLQAKQVLEQAPAVVELVAQRKESVKQSPSLTKKTQTADNSSETLNAKKKEKTTEEDKGTQNNQDKSGEEDKDKSGEEFTESLPAPRKKSQVGGRPQFSRSMSQSDIWTESSVPMTSTSLGYAAMGSTNLNTSWNVSMTGTLPSKTTSIDNLHGSVNSLEDSVSYDYQTIRGGALTYVEQPTRPTEEVLVIELQREATHKLGLSIVGGTDNPSLKSVHVKRVFPDGLVHKDGRIKRGDRIVSVNGQLLEGLTNKEALQLLKSSSSVVTLEVARRIGRRGSQAASPSHSQLQSRHSSGESTREPPSPVMGSHFMTRQRRDSSGSEGGGPQTGPPTPPTLQAPRNTLRRRSRHESLSQEGEEIMALRANKPATMPRKLKSTEGVKVVELHKGPTGLGMNLKGGTDENLPITVREVFPGGTAHKSGKIHPGDIIIEVNNDSFESLTHREALQKLKNYPQGKISLLVRDRMATLPRKAMPQH